MPTYHILTPEDKRTVIRFNKQGYSNGKIAEQIGCSVNTIRVWLRSQGLKSQAPVGNSGKNLALQHTPRIVELYRQDMSLKLIATYLALPYHIVVNAIYQYRHSHDDLPYRHSCRYKR